MKHFETFKVNLPVEELDRDFAPKILCANFVEIYPSFWSLIAVTYPNSKMKMFLLFLGKRISLTNLISHLML